MDVFLLDEKLQLWVQLVRLHRHSNILIEKVPTFERKTILKKKTCQLYLVIPKRFFILPLSGIKPAFITVVHLPLSKLLVTSTTLNTTSSWEYGLGKFLTKNI